MSLTEAASEPRLQAGEPSARDVLWRIALIALGIRAALQVLGMVSVTVDGADPWARALGLWHHWDALHYVRLAEVGYRAEAVPGQNPDDPLYIVFFPLYPLAVRIFSVVFRDLVASGLAVSYVACVLGAWLLYRLVRLDADHAEAWRTVLVLFAFPTAYFLSAPYTEALFLLAVVGSVYAARTGRWAGAGLFGALAAGTRVAGAALGPPLVAEALGGPDPVRAKARRLLWVSVAASGLVAYLAVNQVVHGDALWFLRVQESHWFQRAVPPWTPFIDAARRIADGTSEAHTFIFGGRLAGYAFALPLLVVATRRLRAADSIYGWGGLVLVASTSWLISLPRYLLGLYPLFWVLAKLTSSRRVLLPLLALSTLLQGWLFWRYAAGRWTF